MYGGPGKLGRGRGGGPIKRNIHSTFQPPSVQRPSATPAGGRLSAAGAGAGHRNRSNTSLTPAPVSTADEAFSLVRNNPLNFGMIIRLTPVLVDEIKRLEAQGGVARIKFDATANNPAGNVIDVGGKEFRFTWSQETGDLCDIYEERRSGDSGNGLLVESGGAWRKLNVQRELDESFKNHVKMRTVEAERKHKSRKAIVLDHGTPSMKNQMKALAAAEVNNTWRGSYKQKKEPPFKKMKAEPSTVIPPKSGGKAGFSSSTSSKVRASPSPLLSTPEQPVAPLSPLVNNISKVHASIEDATLTQASKENASVFEKEMPSRVCAGAVQDKQRSKGNFRNKPTDLQSVLISLLKEKPQGMNLKALEKAIGDTVPKFVKQIEPILKKIAIFQAPGRYILKPEVELESSKKPLSESGSSPENNHHNREVTAPNSSFLLKDDDVKELEEQRQLVPEPYEELNTSENVDSEHRSLNALGEKKVVDNSEGPVVSSSLSETDSDSESESTGGSDSGSPAGSGSGSTSDSESDASSNSKEGSDEDVDIMSDDDDIEPKHKLLQLDPELSTPPIPWTTSEGHVHNAADEKYDSHGSDLVELEKDLFGDNQEAGIDITPNTFSDKDVDETTNPLSDRIEHQENEVLDRRLYNDKENVAKDGFQNEQSDRIERIISRTTSKRGSNEKHLDENLEHTKRLKSENWSQPTASRGENFSFLGSPLSRSPDRPIERPYKGTSTQATGRTVRDVNDYAFEKDYNQEFHGNTTSDSPRSGPRSIDLNARAKAPAAMDKPDKGRGLQGNDFFSAQKDKINKEIRDEDGHSKDKRPPRNSGLGPSGDKQLDFHQRKHGALVGKIKESGLVSTSQRKDAAATDNHKTDVRKSPVINGHGITLRRELSDLEMGELRENLNEEISEPKARFERNSSFKQSENKQSSDYWNLDVVKGKPAGRTSLDSTRASLPQSGIGTVSNPDSSSKRRTPEDYFEDFTRPNGKAIQPEIQTLSRVDHVEAGLHSSKLAEVNSKGRRNEGGASQGSGPEGYVDGRRKVPVSAPQKHEKRVVPFSTSDNSRQKSNDLREKMKDSLVDSNDSEHKRRGYSSDDSSSSYTKYEKEEPELKGPIQDPSQYNEYVQEFREKYDSYLSLDKILESYRNEFVSYGRDLELAKGRDNDRYNKILEDLRESYRQYGTKHKRLKKIFVVLHRELQHLKEMISDFAEKQTKG